jgi:hypothetical protein
VRSTRFLELRPLQSRFSVSHQFGAEAPTPALDKHLDTILQLLVCPCWLPLVAHILLAYHGKCFVCFPPTDVRHDV